MSQPPSQHKNHPHPFEVIYIMEVRMRREKEKVDGGLDVDPPSFLGLILRNLRDHYGKKRN
jgi:hypothetical protein